MPQFIDHHRASGPPPPEMVRQANEAMGSGQADPATGVRGLAWMYNDNEQWCVTEAVDAQAVHRYHEGMGVLLGSGDVTEINVVR